MGAKPIISLRYRFRALDAASRERTTQAYTMSGKPIAPYSPMAPPALKKMALAGHILRSRGCHVRCRNECGFSDFRAGGFMQTTEWFRSAASLHYPSTLVPESCFSLRSRPIRMLAWSPVKFFSHHFLSNHYPIVPLLWQWHPECPYSRRRETLPMRSDIALSCPNATTSRNPPQ